jgi:phage terminase large subunit-like protein
MITKSLSEDIIITYNKKFEHFNNCGLDERKRLMKDDPVLFAYGVFRNRKGDRMKLYPFQDLILNDDSKLIALAVARQSGKSVSAVIKAFHHIFYNDNATVLVISKTLKQSTELIDKLRSLINNSPLKDSIKKKMGSVDNRSEFSLVNHGKDSISRIISVPATDAARGFTADLVIADEIAFWDNSVEMFNEAILPTVSETGGKILMLSTPKGKIGVFYDAFTKDNWSSYQFDWRICPHHTEENMRVYKDQVGEFAFRQEMEASFVANQSAYFREAEIKKATDSNIVLGEHTRLPVVAGIDFGKIHDKSVIIIGAIMNFEDMPEYHKIRVIDVIAKPLGTEYNKVVGEVKDIFKKYNIQKIIYDKTGVGEGPGDFMADAGLPVEGVAFSIQSKQNIYSNLKLLFEKSQILIPEYRELKDELLLFEYEYTTSGNMKLHHPEGGHDDFSDALALMAYGLIRTDFVEPSFEVI